MMDWKLMFPAWLVSRREKDALVKRAELTGKARTSRTFLWGIIEVGVEAELVDQPPSPPTQKDTI